MAYLNNQNARQIKKPAVRLVFYWQLVVMIVIALFFGLLSLSAGFAALLGGAVSVAAQGYYNYRALKYFGTPEAFRSVSAAVSGMWGKWVIVIAATLSILTLYEELKAGAYFVGLFGVHTLGAFLLPVLVKKAA